MFQCDDIRDCNTQFCPPYDEHMCSKHIETWNILIIKFSASSWLILRNKLSALWQLTVECDGLSLFEEEVLTLLIITDLGLFTDELLVEWHLLVQCTINFSKPVSFIDVLQVCQTANSVAPEIYFSRRCTFNISTKQTNLFDNN